MAVTAPVAPFDAGAVTSEVASGTVVVAAGSPIQH